MKQPELGQRILELRKKKGLTQDELVDLCNINVRTLQRIENGEVTPRSYTIKTILSALDYDYESLQSERSENQKSHQLKIPSSEAKPVVSLLNLAWISGILFAITAVFEGIADFVRIDDDEFIFGIWGHVFIKVSVIVLNGLLFYGFLVAGNVLKNYLMKIASILMILVLLGFYVFDILSVFYSSLDIEVILIAQSVCFGIIGVILGISILQSRFILGNAALGAGVAELAMAFCLITVIFSPIALALLLPVIVLEVLFLYQLAAKVKEQQN